MIVVGIDTGGTFTDFVVYAQGKLRTHKVLSTPAAPERAILLGLQQMQIDLPKATIIHGSTVATNAVLEGKGARTVFITNRGFADMLRIGRQARAELYNLQPQVIAPPVAKEDCLETGGRLASDGRVLDALSEEDLTQLRERLRQLAPQAVAINFLFSFLDDQYERAVEAVVPSSIPVSRSSDILPEYKEYERGIATWLNAYVSPLMQGYLARLQQGVAPATLSVIHSSGGTMSAELAARRGVNLLLSGPAAGLIGAAHIGRVAGSEHLLTFDMGGTSTDVALVQGEIALTTDARIAGYPVAIPMVNIHTIGAGGGSIAYLDEGGLLHVGPESAGAAPGPACYGQGGDRPTVTDANVVLGRLPASVALGGSLLLDLAAAQAALQPLAESMGCGVEEAALGVITLANEHMAQALRVISVEQGIDPKGYSLLSFGGAGGLHVCALAEALGMRQAIVPINAGVLSAYGMLVAPRRCELSRTHRALLTPALETDINALFATLEQHGVDTLRAEGVSPEQIETLPSVELRYQGQSYTLAIPWQQSARVIEEFHATHEVKYGHRLNEPVELVTLRLTLKGPDPQIKLCELDHVLDQAPIAQLRVYGEDMVVPLYQRHRLGPGGQWHGPALVTEAVSTTYIARGWSCTVDSIGNLLLTRTR